MDCLIVHYNTPELTSATIRSLWKHTPQADVTIFDNSDRKAFPIKEFPQIMYMDNTNGQIVDWDKWLMQFPDKQPCYENNYASAKHCYSVDLCMDMFEEGFILLDSDVLIKQDISPLVDKQKACVGRIHCNTRKYGIRINRLCPWICWINTKKVRQYNIRYFNAEKMWKLHAWNQQITHDGFYDTGAWFWEEVLQHNLPYTNLEIMDFIVHFRAASWKSYFGHNEWLKEHEALWA